MFFSFDGIDGVGKSTQVTLFAQWLRDQGAEIVQCRDPGSTPLGEAIRKILLNHDEARVDQHAEMLLYMAARAQMVVELIKPALQAGNTVVCDRYLLANIAYQAYGAGLPVAEVKAVGKVAIQGIEPDATFVLDIDPQAVAERFESLDRMEARGLEFQRRVREGFLREAALDPEKFHVLDAAASIDSIQQQIRRIAEPLVGKGLQEKESGGQRSVTG